MNILYAPSHRHDISYHRFSYTSCGSLAGMSNSSMGPAWGIHPRKEIIYLSMHWTHLWLYGIEHIVKDHSVRENMGFSFQLAPSHSIAYTPSFVTPVMEHWLEWEIAQRVQHEGSIGRPIAPWANALTREIHLAPTRGKMLRPRGKMLRPRGKMLRPRGKMLRPLDVLLDLPWRSACCW